MPREEVVEMRSGFRMRLDARDPLQRIMAEQRVYEPEVSWIYPYLLRSGDVAIDGGAHIGYLSLLMARSVGASGAVHAFEPLPATVRILAENVALNPWARVEVRPLALAAREGSLELEVPIDPQGTSLLAWGASAVHLRRGRTERVAAVPLDAYADAHRLRRVAVLKLDLEGAELPAIAGAQRLLSERRVAYLVCELNRFLLDAQGARYDALREAVCRHGYTCYRIGKDGRLHPVESAILRPELIVGDLLFARTGRPS